MSKNKKSMPVQSAPCMQAKNNAAIVYNDYDGVPLKITFLGDYWWVTTPGERLQRLEDYFKSEDIDFCYLCEADKKVGALALAKMLGKALENPEDAVGTVMRQRVESLKRLGVRLNVKDEPLMLELEVFSNEGKPARQGKVSAWCRLAHDFCEMLFSVDGFDTKEDAEEWVFCYFEYLEYLGVNYTLK